MPTGDRGDIPAEDENVAAAAGGPGAPTTTLGAAGRRETRSRAQVAPVGAERVLALLSDDGVVVGWTRDAAEIVGLVAGDVVGRRAGFFLGPDNGLTVSAFADQIGSHEGWSNEVRVGRGDRCGLRLSRLSGAAGQVCWLLSAPAGGARGGVLPQEPAERQLVGRAVWDLGLRCIFVNDVVEQQDRVPRVPQLGHRMAQVLPGFDADALEAVMHHVLRTGAAAIDYRYQQRSDVEGPRSWMLAISLFRLEAADGAPLGLCSIAVDLTREQQERERLAVLGEASAAVGTTDEIMGTAQELADFVVPLLADYTAVDLAESVRLGEEPLALLSPDAGRIPVFHRAGVASIHPDMREMIFERGHPVFVPASSPFTEALTTGRSQFQPVLDLENDPWARDPQRAQVLKATGVHSLMIIPVRAGEAVLGITILLRNDNPEPFDEDDLHLAEDLVAHTARQLNLQRTKAHDRAMALALQRNLLPHRLRGGPGVEVTSRFVPADVEEGVGGDWFDVIALAGSRTGLVVGDVAGHGIAAAAAMGRLRTAIRTLAYMDLAPDELLGRVDHVLMSFAEGDEVDEATTSAITGATCLFLVYDPDTRRAVAASAGHPPPAIVSPDGTVAFREVPAGVPLGFGLLRYEQAEFEVAEGSVIALYTDGLVETRGSDIDVGLQRLARALAHPQATLQELCDAAFDARPMDDLARKAKLQLREPADDATLLLARTGKPAAGRPPAGSPDDGR